MIAFTCKQCGRRFERPDHLAGTLVFCACGAGTHVPWESTVPPEEAPAPPVGSLRPRWAETAANPEPEVPRVLPRNPANCFNHPDMPAAEPCADCKEPFCSGCLVRFQGAMICGPCKNFRLRGMERAPHLSVMAILSALLSLGAGAVWPFVQLWGLAMQSQASATIGIAVIGMVPQLAAFVMAGWALREVETGKGVGGRSWAVTGLVSVLVSSALIVLLALLAIQARG